MIKKWFISTLILCSAWLHATEHFQQFTHTAADGKERPYIVFSPNHQATHKRPLLVFLHGAINGKLHTDPIATAKRNKMLDVARKGDFFILFPFGEKGATWFDEIGSNMVLQQIQRVSQDFSIDDNKIFLSGFSDGASGTFYLATTQPERFAGFLAFNGSPAVADALGKHKMFFDNLNGKPFYMFNTLEDMLYPAEMMRPLVQKIHETQPQLRFDTPQGNHDMNYIHEKTPLILEFIQNHQKNVPSAFSWESDGSLKSNMWAEITEMNTQEAAQSWHSSYRVKMRNNRAKLDAGLDIKHQGDGIKITHIKTGGTADKLGLKSGDVVLKIDNTPMKTDRHTYANYIASKRAGDAVQLTILRDGNIINLSGKFNDGYDYSVFKHETPSAKIKMRLEHDILTVETSRIARFSIDFNQLPKTNIQQLIINGQSVPFTPQGIQEFTVP